MASSLNGTGVTFSDSTVLNSNGVNIQTFNSGGSTTWTKPTDGKVMARIQVWGGGGGGGRHSASTGAAGGGGGAYNEIVVPLAYLDTQTVTVAAGGTGRTSSAGAGTAGGFSSVAINATGQAAGIRATITAYGGGGGGNSYYQNPGLGGGQLGAGGTANSTNYYNPGGSPVMVSNVDPYDGTGYSVATLGGYSNLIYVPLTGGMWHGGCGGAGAQSTVGGNSVTGNAIWGGAGGFSGSSTLYTGWGISIYGGDGGRRSVGTVPAGGGAGGYGANINGYNGAAGRIIITCW